MFVLHTCIPRRKGAGEGRGEGGDTSVAAVILLAAVAAVILDPPAFAFNKLIH